MAESRAKSAMSGGHKKSAGKKKPGRHVRQMHIRHAANGGYVVNHDYDHAPGEMPSSEDEMPHVAGDMNGLLDHVQEHMDQTPATPPGGSAPAPQAMAGGM